MIGTTIKPPCRLPEVFTPSYLIGNTVNALVKAGLPDRAHEFTHELSKTGAISDYHHILDIAARYVEFR
jgi:hypothetical protein